MFPHGQAQNPIYLLKGLCYPEIKIIQEKKELRLAVKGGEKKEDKSSLMHECSLISDMPYLWWLGYKP